MQKAIAALSLFFLLPAAAQAVPVRWQGDFQITAIGGACDGVRIGTSGRVRFRPGIAGENGSNSSLSMFSPRQTANYTLVDGLFDDSFQTVATMYIGDVTTPIDNRVKVRFSRQKPAVLDSSVDFVDITAQIRGYDMQPRCVVTVRIVLFRRDV